MSVTETIFQWGRKGNLVSILAEPAVGESPAPRTAVVLTNSRELHRTGPHGLYVDLARRLAALGLPTVRFDYSGIGDSLDPEYSTSWSQAERERSAVEDTQDVMDHLQEERGIQHFVLVGNCAGAYVSVKAACREPRVRAVAAINAPIELFSEDPGLIQQLEDRRRSTQLVRGSYLDPVRWKRLLTGKTSPMRIFRVLLSRLRGRRLGRGSGPEQGPQGMGELRLLRSKGIRACMVFSQDELVYEYLLKVVGREALQQLSPTVEFHVLSNADHLFIQHRTCQGFVEDLCDWMHEAAQEDSPSDRELAGFRQSQRLLDRQDPGATQD